MIPALSEEQAEACVDNQSDELLVVVDSVNRTVRAQKGIPPLWLLFAIAAQASIMADGLKGARELGVNAGALPGFELLPDMIGLLRRAADELERAFREERQ